jgi:hypothetical protein
MNRTTIVLLKALIAILIALLVFCQVFVIPRTVSGLASVYPEFSDLVWPGIIVGGVFALCAEVLLVCVWRLVTLVRVDSIFSERAFIWVDVALAAVSLATVLVIGALVILMVAGASPPSISLLCLIGAIVGAGLSLLLVVLRGLLRKASQLERDLSEVV